MEATKRVPLTEADIRLLALRRLKAAEEEAAKGIQTQTTTTSEQKSERGSNGHPPVKRTRFSPVGKFYCIPNYPTDLTLARYLPRDAFDALLVRVRIDEINNAIATNQLWPEEEDARRSPSPPPKYDATGKRTNTREQRARDKLNLERQKLIQEALAYHPMLSKLPGSGPRPIIKKTNKIPIPIDRYPDYNFMGVLIGPRGDTHKMLEKTTGTKISIRGKGSTKDGVLKQGGAEDDSEPLHVLIVADTQEQLDKATAEVERLLIPIDDELNPHKSLQLRKLAEYNGTLRLDWGTKDEKTRRFANTEVKCSFCGETSHPTKDCPIKAQPGAKSRMDIEYESFMSELGTVAKDPNKENSFENSSSFGQSQPRKRPRSPSPSRSTEEKREGNNNASQAKGGIGPWTIPKNSSFPPPSNSNGLPINRSGPMAPTPYPVGPANYRHPKLPPATRVPYPMPPSRFMPPPPLPLYPAAQVMPNYPPQPLVHQTQQPQHYPYPPTLSHGYPATTAPPVPVYNGMPVQPPPPSQPPSYQHFYPSNPLPPQPQWNLYN